MLTNLKFRRNDASVKSRVFGLGDAMSHIDSWRFSAQDRDQDTWDLNCAERFKGAWWYSDCHSTNPNGLYLGGATDQYATGIIWFQWRGHHYSMKKMEIKIRKKNN